MSWLGDGPFSISFLAELPRNTKELGEAEWNFHLTSSPGHSVSIKEFGLTAESPAKKPRKDMPQKSKQKQAHRMCTQDQKARALEAGKKSREAKQRTKQPVKDASG